MELHRVVADAEAGGDQLVGQPLREELEDLLLAGRKVLDGGGGRRTRAEDGVGGGPVQHHQPLRHRAHRRGQSCRRDVAKHHAPGPRPDRLRRLAFVGEDGQDPEPSRAGLRQVIEARRRAGADVPERDLGSARAGTGRQLVRVELRFDQDARLARQKGYEAAADQRILAHDDHAHLVHAGGPTLACRAPPARGR